MLLDVEPRRRRLLLRQHRHQGARGSSGSGLRVPGGTRVISSTTLSLNGVGIPTWHPCSETYPFRYCTSADVLARLMKELQPNVPFTKVTNRTPSFISIFLG